MTSIVTTAEAKIKAAELIAEDDFKSAVALAKQQLAESRLHLLPFKITLQWPIKFSAWPVVRRYPK